MSELSYGQLFDKSWATIRQNLALSAGLTLVYFLAAVALSMIPFLGGFLTTLIVPGYMYSLIQIRDNKSIEYKDFFWCVQDFNRLLHWLVANTIKTIAIIVGFILLIVPGIYLAIALALSEPYFIFRKQDGIDSLKGSVHLVDQNWWFMCGLLLFIGILNIVGVLCFLIGVLVTIPTSTLILLYAMEALEKKHATEKNVIDASIS